MLSFPRHVVSSYFLLVLIYFNLLLPLAQALELTIQHINIHHQEGGVNTDSQ